MSLSFLVVSAQRCLICGKAQPVTVKCLHLPLRGGGQARSFKQNPLPISQLSESGQLWPLVLMIEATPASKIKTLSNEKPWWVRCHSSSWLCFVERVEPDTTGSMLLFYFVNWLGSPGMGMEWADRSWGKAGPGHVVEKISAVCQQQGPAS